MSVISDLANVKQRETYLMGLSNHTRCVVDEIL